MLLSFYLDDRPLTVVVTPGRWDAIDVLTPRNLMLTQMLKNQGGIADSVPPGTYHFNVKLVADEWLATLEPAA